jgi:hypothetical protein
MQLDGWCCTLGRKPLPSEASQRDAETETGAEAGIQRAVWIGQLCHAVTHCSAQCAHQQSDQDVGWSDHSSLRGGCGWSAYLSNPVRWRGTGLEVERRRAPGELPPDRSGFRFACAGQPDAGAIKVIRTDGHPSAAQKRRKSCCMKAARILRTPRVEVVEGAEEATNLHLYLRGGCGRCVVAAL